MNKYDYYTVTLWFWYNFKKKYHWINGLILFWISLIEHNCVFVLNLTLSDIFLSNKPVNQYFFILVL